jgi:hypothetical protein
VAILCGSLNITLNSAKGDRLGNIVRGSDAQLAILETSDGTYVVTENVQPPAVVSENLRTLFWNSNGWDVEKARRISRVAADERAHVLCLVDTRQGMVEAGKKLSTLKFLLQLKTGMKWSSHNSPAPAGAKAGGSFILTSEVVKVVSYSEIIAGGILSGLKIKWGHKDMKVISLYTPSAE